MKLDLGDRTYPWNYWGRIRADLHNGIDTSIWDRIGAVLPTAPPDFFSDHIQGLLWRPQ